MGLCSFRSSMTRWMRLRFRFCRIVSPLEQSCRLQHGKFSLVAVIFTVLLSRFQNKCIDLNLWDGEPTCTLSEHLVVSYVNFDISNGVVLVPQFNDPMDAVAVSILQDCFPTRTVVPIAAREILIGGGNIHCITQQIPK